MNGIALQLAARARLGGGAHASTDWDQGKKMERLWARDASLWTEPGRGKVARLAGHRRQGAAGQPGAAKRSCAEIAGERFDHALLLGMGGSSPVPGGHGEDLRPGEGQAGAARARLDRSGAGPVVRGSGSTSTRTLFIVSSKSGSTLEPNIFFQYFWAETVKVIGQDKAGRRFVAITDPGSKMETAGERRTASAPSSPAGRASAAATRRCPTSAWCRRRSGRGSAPLPRQHAERWCTPARPVPASKNPGVIARRRPRHAGAGAGRDKVTLVPAPASTTLGAWLEQLLAESTGKEGKGHHPGRPRGARRRRTGYGDDRALRLPAPRVRARRGAGPGGRGAGEGRAARGAHLGRRALRAGQEFFRWEIATAVAGVGAGHQPVRPARRRGEQDRDAQADRRYEKTGTLPPRSGRSSRTGRWRCSPTRRTRRGAARAARRWPRCLHAHLGRLAPGDYFALLAYVPMTPEHEALLQAARHRVRDASRSRPASASARGSCTPPGRPTRAGRTPASSCRSPATMPATCRSRAQKYTFGVVKAAQARGDFAGARRRGSARAARPSARTASGRRCESCARRIDQAARAGALS